MHQQPEPYLWEIRLEYEKHIARIADSMENSRAIFIGVSSGRVMMMGRKVLSLALVAFLAVGCASGVKRGPGVTANATERPANNQIQAVTVVLTDSAKSKVADNLKFNPDELLGHVKRALDGNSLIDSTNSHTNMEIQIKDFRVRSNFSAVMWGFMAGADSVTADIVLKDSGGKEFDRFEVSASYALGGLGGGQDSARMDWLYEKFAEETVKELAKK